MNFLRKLKKKIQEICVKKENKKFKVAEIKIARCYIVSSETPASIGTPLGFKHCFAVREKNSEYYEIFSNKRLESGEGKAYYYFDTAYIKKIIPVEEFLTDPNEKYIESVDLFDLILLLNIQEELANQEKIH